MFTIKYRTYVPSKAQQASSVGDPFPPTLYDEHEIIDGPFALISKEMDDGYTVIYAHRDQNAPGMTFGPNTAVASSPSSPRATLWVMNEAGATVAKYDL